MARTAILLLAAWAACAEVYPGTVVDTTCRGSDLPNHTRECALKCGRTGFGVVLADGRFLKFDEQGNALALKLLRQSTRDKDLQAAVTGVLDGPVLKVQSIAWK